MSDSKTIAITASFTAEPLQQVLQFLNNELALQLKFEFAQFNQIFQELYQPDGLLASNQTGANVLLIRPEDWSADESESTSAASREIIQKAVDDFLKGIVSASKKFAVPSLVVLCPPSERFLSVFENRRLVQDIEARFSSELVNHAGIYFLPYKEIDRYYPVEKPMDLLSDRNGKIPYTPEYFVSIGTMIIRNSQLSKDLPSKYLLWTVITHFGLAFAARWVPPECRSNIPIRSFKNLR